jgi:hypothetical protein
VSRLPLFLTKDQSIVMALPVPFGSNLPRGEAVLDRALFELMNTEASLRRLNKPPLPEWDMLHIDAGADSFAVAKADFTNVDIWRGILRSGVDKGAVISQIADFIDHLKMITALKDAEAQRSWSNAFMIATNFAAVVSGANGEHA